MIIEGNLGAVRRASTPGNDDLLSFDTNFFTVALNLYGMGI
jgi:hypothetical protein